MISSFRWTSRSYANLYLETINLNNAVCSLKQQQHISEQMQRCLKRASEYVRVCPAVDRLVELPMQHVLSPHMLNESEGIFSSYHAGTLFSFVSPDISTDLSPSTRLGLGEEGQIPEDEGRAMHQLG
ncbi:hypothetical protein MRB53_040916 [Persea americana]|nr:hypothetical protein MRB53_040916 [Persea americana]